MIIDSHTHIHEMNGKELAPEDLITSMDEAGIDYSILIADDFAGKGVPTQRVVEIAKQYPRLKAVGNVSYPSFDSSQLEIIKGYIKNKEIVGVKFYPGYEPFYPLDEKLFPLYEFCAERNVPVMFHSGILVETRRGLLKYSHPLNIDEVADRFPELKIIIAHMGNPWLMDCAAVMSRNKNVYADCSGYFKEFAHIEQEEEEFFREQMKQFRLFVGDFKKLLFGTDWPIYFQNDYLKAVQSLPMTDEERELVFYKNAQNLFRIEN